MLNGEVYFYAATYRHRGSYSNLLSFVNKFARALRQSPFEQRAVLGTVDRIRSDLTVNANILIDQDAALKILLRRDLDGIRQVLSSEQFAIEMRQEAIFETSLQTTLDAGLKLLAEIGLEVDRPRLFIVEAIPHPYDKADYRAVATDEGDWVRYRIEPGIYFVRRHLQPIYTRFLLLHELIHPIAARSNPFLLGRGLEEGIAELLGAMYLSGNILGYELTRNLFIYNRLYFGCDQFWDLYLDYTRQAVYIYNRFGLTAIVNLLMLGRTKIKTVEDALTRGRLWEVELPLGHWDEDLTLIANELCLTYCRNLVVSPLAKYLLPFVIDDTDYSGIFKEARVSSGPGTQAIRELQGRVVLAICDERKSRIALGDAGRFVNHWSVRYEIPNRDR